MRVFLSVCVCRCVARVLGIAATVVLALSVSGCGELQVQESEIATSLPQKTAPIVLGQTDRADVRQGLGKPWLSSEYWGFDLFRVSDSNVSMIVILIPVWAVFDSSKGYVLVSYDASGKVVAYGTDVARRGSLYAGTPDEAAAAHAGDVRFAASGDGDEAFVAVASARRDEYLLSHPPEDGCGLLVGCLGDWCGARVAIDGRSTIAMPDALTRWLPAVAPVRVMPGNHRVEVSPSRWSYSFAAETEFSCVTGESLYVVIDFPSGEDPVVGGFRRKFPATVTISREMPGAFQEQGMLIYGNGAWLVNEKPGK